MIDVPHGEAAGEHSDDPGEGGTPDDGQEPHDPRQLEGHLPRELGFHGLEHQHARGGSQHRTTDPTDHPDPRRLQEHRP